MALKLITNIIPFHHVTCVIFIICYHHHNLCIDIIYIIGLQYVSAFWPSSGITHVPLADLHFPLHWPVFTHVYFLVSLFIKLLS